MSGGPIRGMLPLKKNGISYMLLFALYELGCMERSKLFMLFCEAGFNRSAASHIRERYCASGHLTTTIRANRPWEAITPKGIALLEFTHAAEAKVEAVMARLRRGPA